MRGKAYLNGLVSQIDTKNIDFSVKVLKGNLIDTLKLIGKAADIDLILIEPRTNSVKDEVFLGNTSGKIIKQTQMPALIIPENYVFKPITRILLAVKSAILKKENSLKPLLDIKNKF